MWQVLYLSIHAFSSSDGTMNFFEKSLRVYRHLLLGDSCRYALLDLRASFWRQSRISNKYFCDSPTRGFSVLANRRLPYVVLKTPALNV